MPGRSTARLATLGATLGATLAGSLMLAACGEDPLAPRDVAGAWVLTLPPGALAVAADTLFLDAAGSGERRRHMLANPADSTITPLVYRVDGQRLIVTYSCGRPPCEPNAAATIRGATLTLTAFYNPAVDEGPHVDHFTRLPATP